MLVIISVFPPSSWSLLRWSHCGWDITLGLELPALNTSVIHKQLLTLNSPRLPVYLIEFSPTQRVTTCPLSIATNIPESKGVIEKEQVWEFPGGLVVTILDFQYCGLGSIPGPHKTPLHGQNNKSPTTGSYQNASEPTKRYSQRWDILNINEDNHSWLKH